MSTISWTVVKERAKKRKGWVALGSTLFVSGFVSFSNHPEWGVWCSAFGFVITLVSLLKK